MMVRVKKILYVFDRDTDILQKAHKNTYFQAYIIQCIVSIMVSG